MEINPYESRLRMLQQFDGVQMQREAAPDEETAGCPGCPYFWTCPIPHQGEEVQAPQEIELEDVQHEHRPRRAVRPRDEADIGWLDDDDEAEPEKEPDAGPEAEPQAGAPDDLSHEDTPAEDDAVTRPRGWWNPFRRRRGPEGQQIRRPADPKTRRAARACAARARA